MTRTITWLGRAALSGAVLIGVLAMHALTGPHTLVPAMTAETMTMPTARAAQHPATDLATAASSCHDASMCGHDPLRGHRSRARPPAVTRPAR